MTAALCIDAAIDELGLPSRSVRVYVHLAAVAARQECAPSYSSIGAACFAPDLPTAKPETWRRLAIAAVRELVERGLVCKEKQTEASGAAGVNRYRLTSRDEWLMTDGREAAPAGGASALPGDDAPLDGALAPRSDSAPPDGAHALPGDGGSRSGAVHPALEVYRTVFALMPGPQQAQAIVETVDDCVRWREVLTKWAGKGYKPANVFDQLDVYRNGWREQARSGRTARSMAMDVSPDAGADSWSSFIVPPLFEEASHAAHS